MRGDLDGRLDRPLAAAVRARIARPDVAADPQQTGARGVWTTRGDLLTGRPIENGDIVTATWAGAVWHAVAHWDRKDPDTLWLRPEPSAAIPHLRTQHNRHDLVAAIVEDLTFVGLIADTRWAQLSASVIVDTHLEGVYEDADEALDLAIGTAVRPASETPTDQALRNHQRTAGRPTPATCATPRTQAQLSESAAPSECRRAGVRPLRSPPMANPWADPGREAAMRTAIGTRLRALREDHQLFLTDASELSGVSYSYLSEVERGLKMPTLPTLVALCETYGLLVTEFFSAMYPFGVLEPPNVGQPEN